MKPTKCFNVSRVSTTEQKDAGNSLPAQSNRLDNYSQRKEFEVIKRYSFDESAYKTRREDFDAILQEIIDYVMRVNEVVAVCFDKVDRLSRNIFDKRVSQLYQMAIDGKIELHFASDGQVINSQISATEKFQFGISLGLAKYYSDAISDNVKRAQEQMLRARNYPAKPPYGYKRVPIGKDKSEVVIDDYAANMVRKAFEWYASGSYSMDLLRKKLKTDFGINWSKGFIDKVLKDEFYIGIMTWNKRQYPHKYPPIVDKPLFDQVKQIKSGFNKKRFKYAGKPYPYRGLLRCGVCGLAITPEKHKNHIYYHCTQYNGKHQASWIREEDITQQLGAVFKQLQLPDDVYKQILDVLWSNHDAKMDFRQHEYAQLTTEREKYVKRLEQLYIDKLDGRITDSEYDKFYQLFRQKIAEIDARLTMLQQADDNYYLTANYLVELTNRAYELFVGSEVEEKRQHRFELWVRRGALVDYR